MIDLKSVPRPTFGWALESNLRRLGPLYKVYHHFVGALALHLEADAVWLHRRARGRRPFPKQVEEKFLVGDSSLRDEALVDAFAREERPELPPTVVLTPLVVHERRVGVVGAARRGRSFERGASRLLNRLAATLEIELARREEEHLTHVLDRIKRKVVAELRPTDLAYQILDGLFELLHYDHSAALLTYEEGRTAFRVGAEKIAWTKAKSQLIGHEIPVPPDLLRELGRRREPAILMSIDSANGPDPLRELYRLLDYHRERGAPALSAILVAPLFFEAELLGVLKIAAAEPGAFVRKDLEVVERFLPAAAVSLRNVGVKLSLERQAMAAELRASLVTLARAVAHDVNNAIGAILPLAQQAREDLAAGGLDPNSLSQDLAVIIEKANLCKRIFTNMLRAGSERSGGGPLELNAVIREMTPLLEAQIAARPIALRFELEEGLGPIRFSRPHLERVLWNLVTNAIEALDGKRGEIRVSTRPAHGSGAVLIVSDNGAGIAPENLNRVAEPFFTTKPNGTGLGLSICRALVWQYGGTLDIESASGRGTEVRVTFAGEGPA
jgi:signal transduction histidine kinase